MNKSINELSVYELGGVDSEVWLSQNDKFGFDLEIETEEQVYTESGIHPYAAMALADFCRQYLRSYDRVMKEVA